MDTELHLEGTPTDSQKDRLEDFLAELTFISRRYGIALRDRAEALELVDLPTGHVLGLGVELFGTDSCQARHYVPMDSILDGAWPVDGPEGPVEQRSIMNVFPRRPAPQAP